MVTKILPIVLALLAAASCCYAEERPLVDIGEPFSKVIRVDEIACGNPADPHEFAEAPDGVSLVEPILGQPCRVLPTAGESKYFAYRIGAGKGLQAGKAYVLEVVCPEDKPRMLYLINRGAEMNRGWATGAAIPDAIQANVTQNNPESLRIPLSGRYESARMMFYLHDRFGGIVIPRGQVESKRPYRPADGFWVIVAQSDSFNHPLSAGAAVKAIRLYEVPDPESLNQPLRLPPEDLPRRHLFWREEMSDGVINARDKSDNGLINPSDWYEYKMRLMKFWGMDTFSKDLLEFGHNQGWDSSPHGGSAWVNQSRWPDRWEGIINLAAKYNVSVLPYYEYAGSIGTGELALGSQKRAMPLTEGKDYTHIAWTEKGNVDLTDPDTLTDVENLLDATITRYKGRVEFLGAWFRPRPAANPIGFGDATLDRFAAQANDRQPITREMLRNDDALMQRYRDWWFDQRKAFLLNVRDYLRENVNPDAIVLYTTDVRESGKSMGKYVITDDVPAWKRLLARPNMRKLEPIAFDTVVEKDMHLAALTSFQPTWGNWDWTHAVPPADPADYRDVDGVLLTMTINRAYTVSSPTALEAFRTPTGLAVVKHYALNENLLGLREHEKLGYFVCDVDRAGPYAMLAEARAVANGDPRYIGYLSSNCFTRNFPKYVRAFNAAFLSLPALPSKVLDGAADAKGVAVRAIETEKHGTYLAVVNTDFEPTSVTVTLPADGTLTNAATGEAMTATDGRVELEMHPCQLIALHIQP